MNYVNGFMINPETRMGLFIHKNRPAFQAGRWNGIGGKIEPGESRIEAMCREFYEEAGVVTTANDWEPTLSLEGRHFAVHFYRSFVSEFPAFKTVTDEVVGLQFIENVYNFPCLDNMKWILPLIANMHVRFPLTIQWQDAH